MRKLAMLLAVLMAIPTGSWAGALGLENITFDGSLEVLGQQAQNETDFNSPANDHRGNSVTRVRVGMTADVTEGVTGRVEAVRLPRQYGTGATTVAGEENAVTFENAYLDIADFFYTDKVRLGRQYGGRKGDLLCYYGPQNDDALSVTALDALRVEKKIGKIDALFVTGKINEDDALSNTDAGDATGDINATYLILSSDSLFEGYKIPLELGYYQAKDSNTDLANDNVTLVVYDLRASYGFLEDALTVSGEFAKNAGQSNTTTNGGATDPTAVGKFKGSAYVLKADYKLQDRNLAFNAMMANATGDPQQNNTSADDKAFHDGADLFAGAVSNDFRYGEIMTNSNTLGGGPGLGTGANGRGINVIGLGATYTPENLMDGKLSFKADFFSAKANKVVDQANKKIGTEIDLCAKYKYSETVTAKVGYAMFTPGEGTVTNFTPTTGTIIKDKVTKAWAKLIVKFGAGEEEASMPVKKPAMKSKPR